MNDLDRLKKEYEDREIRLFNSDLYSLSNPAYRFMKSQFHHDLLEMLVEHGCREWASKRILEVGCGNGNVLMEFTRLGIPLQNLYGVDLITRRLQQAHNNYPSLPLVCADGQKIPFHDAAFEMVIQFTVFSSILDARIKNHIAMEIKRVLKPNGVILWYDFWWNPLNPQTRGIRLNEVQQLFLGMKMKSRKITLAPPIARRLAPISLSLCSLLERLKIFNSHYLVLIEPDTNASP